MLALRDLQERFFQSIAAAPGPSAAGRFDVTLLQVLEGRGRLDAAARLDVYAQMYWARLHDVLYDDFPKTARALGSERFQRVACAHLARHPSEHPSVRHVGRGFADLLDEAPDVADVPFVGDLARLEWARLDVFDAADAEPLHLEDLRRIAPEDWPHLRLELVPAVRRLRVGWAVCDVWAMIDAGQTGVCPTALEANVRVWRDGFVVYQATMDPAECAAFERVANGEPFSSMCDALAPIVGLERAADEAARMVLRWIEDGLLARSGEQRDHGQEKA